MAYSVIARAIRFTILGTFFARVAGIRRVKSEALEPTACDPSPLSQTSVPQIQLSSPRLSEEYQPNLEVRELRTQQIKASETLAPDETVEVLSATEILATLDAEGSLRVSPLCPRCFAIVAGAFGFSNEQTAPAHVDSPVGYPLRCILMIFAVLVLHMVTATLRACCYGRKRGYGASLRAVTGQSQPQTALAHCLPLSCPREMMRPPMRTWPALREDQTTQSYVKRQEYEKLAVRCSSVVFQYTVRTVLVGYFQENWGQRIFTR